MSWSDDDKQRFADGDRLKASTVPGRRPTGPSVAEWADYDDVSMEILRDRLLRELAQRVDSGEPVSDVLADMQARGTWQAVREWNRGQQ